MHIDIQFGKRFVPTAPVQYINDDWNQPEFFRNQWKPLTVETQWKVPSCLERIMWGLPFWCPNHFQVPIPERWVNSSGKRGWWAKPLHKAACRLFALGWSSKWSFLEGCLSSILLNNMVNLSSTCASSPCCEADRCFCQAATSSGSTF